MKTSLKSGITVVINTKNADQVLGRCLDSVPFADQIVVVDMQSSDNTVEVAKKYTSKIFSHKDIGYADPARTFALSKVETEWVLVLDADEWLPSRLQEMIPELISDSQVDCYFLPRRNQIFSKWIEHTGWWPDYQPRLFKNGSVSWEVGVHRQPDISGNTEHLPATIDHAICHENYVDISHFISKLNTYTSIAAQEKVDQKDLVTSKKIVQTFTNELMSRYFDSKGYKESVHGLSLSLLQSMYQAVEAMKIWELQGYPSSKKTEREAVQEFSKMATALKYWTATWNVEQSKGLNKLVWKLRRKFSL